MFCMMAGTEKGREVRQYYLDCEEHLKQQLAQPAQPTVSRLDPVDEVEKWANILKFAGLEESPRHMQYFRDIVSDRMVNAAGVDLEPAEPVVKWYGVAEIAEQLGFHPYSIRKLRSPLGRVVAGWFRKQFDEEPREEERHCEGTFRDVKVYQRSPELDSIIENYLDGKQVRRAALRVV